MFGMPATGCISIFCEQYHALVVLVDIGCIKSEYSLSVMEMMCPEGLPQHIVYSHQFRFHQILVFRFCLHDIEYAAPLPNDMTIPLWLCMYRIIA